MATDARTDEYLAAARAGTPDALGRALESCRAYLLLVAEREMAPSLKAKGGASDIVQQTFLEAQQAFARFGGVTQDGWRAWLRRMLLNNVVNFRRHWEGAAKRRASREEPFAPGGDPAASGPTPSRELMAGERAAAVRAALARLPE